MKSLHLGDVEDFPFLESPLPRMVTDGYQLLAELGAIDETSEGSDADRPRVGQAATRSEDRPHDSRRTAGRLPRRDGGHRVGTVRAGSARSACGCRRRGGPGPRQVEGRAFRVPLLPQALACRRRDLEARELQQAAPVVPAEFHFLAAAARMARRAWAVDDALPRALVEGKPATRQLRSRSTARCWPACSATSASSTRPSRITSAPAASSSSSTPAPVWSRRPGAGSSRPSWSRPRGFSPVASRRSSPNGWRASAPTWSVATSSSRTGRRARGRWWRGSASRCTA